MNDCYYCNAKPVHKDAQGFVYIHNPECPIIEREVKAMVEEKTPTAESVHYGASRNNVNSRKFYG